MQQVILAAGKGTRLGAKETNKCLIDVCGKTLLEYNLELGAEINVNKIIIVVGYNWHFIRNYLKDNYRGIPVCYVHQQHQLGVAHAVKVAAPQISDSFFLCLGDELLIKPKVRDMSDLFINERVDCVCGITADSAENIKKAYTLDFDNKGVVTRLVEKPKEVFNAYKGTGYCVMSRSMLDVLERLTPNTVRCEYEMGDWIQSAINDGLKCMVFEVALKDFNINEHDDLIFAIKAIKGM